MKEEKVKDIEAAVTELNRKELSMFSKWFFEYQNEIWDRQIEEDVEEGKFDDILNEVDEEYKSGNIEEL